MAVLPICLCCAGAVDSLYSLNGSLWVERLTRCEHGLRVRVTRKDICCSKKLKISLT